MRDLESCTRLRERLKKIQEMELSSVLHKNNLSELGQKDSRSSEDPVLAPDIIINIVPSKNVASSYELVLQESIEDIENNSADPTSSSDTALTSADTALTSADTAPASNTNLLNPPKKLCENILFRIFLTSLLLIICSPFIICNFYFAETDVSCVNEETGLGLTFRTIFIIDASLSIAFVFLIGLINDELYSVCSTFFYNLFNFIWLIIECIIFFSFMNSGRLCNHSVYTYIMTSLIMKIIGQGVLTLKFICGSSE